MCVRRHKLSATPKLVWTLRTRPRICGKPDERQEEGYEHYAVLEANGNITEGPPLEVPLLLTC